MKTPLRILHLEDSRTDVELVHETLAAEGITHIYVNYSEWFRLDTSYAITRPAPGAPFQYAQMDRIEKELLHEFADVQVKPAVTAYDLRFGRRRFAPRWMLRLIPDRLGRFLLIRAHK